MRRQIRRALEIFSSFTAVISMIVVPPAAGVLAIDLWKPFAGEAPSLLAGLWTAVVVAAVIKASFE